MPVPASSLPPTQGQLASPQIVIVRAQAQASVSPEQKGRGRSPPSEGKPPQTLPPSGLGNRVGAAVRGTLGTKNDSPLYNLTHRVCGVSSPAFLAPALPSRGLQGWPAIGFLASLTDRPPSAGTAPLT